MFQSSNVELLLYLFGAEFDEYGGTKKLDQFCLFYEIQGVLVQILKGMLFVLKVGNWGQDMENVFGNAQFETNFSQLFILEKWALLENSKGFIYLFIFLGGICLPNLYKNINEENDMIKKSFPLLNPKIVRPHFLILQQNKFKKICG